MDCIATYHLNPMRCGIAKFNRGLARRLEVPVVAVFDEALAGYREPLLSIRLGEFTAEDRQRLDALLDRVEGRQRPHVFLHGFDDSALERRLLKLASTVYCANVEMLERVRPLRADAVLAWCPGMIDASDRFEEAELSVFTFGMAHKVKVRHYRRLRELLDATGKSYALYVSTALHENTEFDEEFGTAFDEMKDIFGGRAYFLGYLSDAAVYNRLLDSTYFAAFFDRGVRANNTSVNAAMEAGCVVVTNLDEHSPSAFEHGRNLVDIVQATSLPTDRADREAIGCAAREVSRGALGWDALLAAMRPPASAPAAARHVNGRVRLAPAPRSP